MLITKKTATHSENSQNQRFNAWWKKNWKKVVVSVVVVGGTILVIKNWDKILVAAEELAASLKPEAKMPTPVVAPNVVEEIDVAPIVELAKDVVRKSPVPGEDRRSSGTPDSASAKPNSRRRIH